MKTQQDEVAALLAELGLDAGKRPELEDIRNIGSVPLVVPMGHGYDWGAA